MAAKLAGRRVLVTGASSGIGRAAVDAFVAAGARVVAVARTGNRLAEIAARHGGPPRVEPVVADVADPVSMDAMAGRVLARGVPDVVVANAGVGLDALFVNLTDRDLHRVLEVNVVGVVRTVRPFLPGMLERGSGRVLLVSSIVGKRGVPSYAGYSASKFALHGMADALRVETWGTGVTVGVVCPSSTETGFRDRALREGPQQRRYRVARHSAESVALALVKMARSRRREMVLSAEAKLMAFANKFVPGIVDRVLARALRPPTARV